LRQLSGKICVKWTFELRVNVAVKCVAKETKNLPANLASKCPANGSSNGTVIGAARSRKTIRLLSKKREIRFDATMTHRVMVAATVTSTVASNLTRLLKNICREFDVSQQIRGKLSRQTPQYLVVMHTHMHIHMCTDR
jgi:hypothetical protein